MKKAMLICTVLMAAAGGCKNHDEQFEEILRLEDRRGDVRELTRFIMHPSAEVKRRAVIAMGRMRDAQAVTTLVDLLDNSNAALRGEAAFALGQIADPSAAKVILKNFNDEKDLEVRLALIEALSKVAKDSLLPAIDSTLSHQLDEDIPIVRAETALALARLVQRQLPGKEWGAKLAVLLTDEAEEVRWRAAYALMRLADPSTAPALRDAVRDRSPRVRMQVARALGALRDPAAWVALALLAHSDPDWRVRVNATAALGQIDPTAEPLLTIADVPLEDSCLHVRLTALRALGSAAERARQAGHIAVSDSMATFLNSQIRLAMPDSNVCGDWRITAAVAYALAQARGKKAVENLLPLAGHPERYLRAEIARALGATAAPEAFPILEKLSNDPDNLVRIAALEALPKIAAQNRALPIYLNALTRGDAVLTALAAQNLVADSSQRSEHALAIMSAYHQLTPPIETECAQMIFDALADCGNRKAQALLEEALKTPDKPFAGAAATALQKLTGKDYTASLPKAGTPQQSFTIAEIKALRGRWARVQTDRGEIELELLPEEAPLTVLNFVRLAEKKFFDGLDVHRVVPNFVMQTGDPRGDMWGSPGYSIRSEFNRLRYVRGTVGMASAGPDTEGSQWFITTSDQPHLDGRYTIFARVRKGMEIVEALQVGDKIHHVTIQH
jgi:cyclophilin family peptidyl-prolyl cis-trans isomerase/HEAT repeat protein